MIPFDEAKKRLLRLSAAAKERRLTVAECRHAQALAASIAARGLSPRELGLSLRQLGLSPRSRRYVA